MPPALTISSRASESVARLASASAPYMRAIGFSLAFSVSSLMRGWMPPHSVIEARVSSFSNASLASAEAACSLMKTRASESCWISGCTPPASEMIDWFFFSMESDSAQRA